MTMASELTPGCLAIKNDDEATLHSIRSVPSSSTTSGAGTFFACLPLPPRLVVVPPIFISPLLLNDVDGSEISENESNEIANHCAPTEDEEVPIDPYAAARAICMLETRPLPSLTHKERVVLEDAEKSSGSSRNGIRLGTHLKQALLSALQSVLSTCSRPCPSPSHSAASAHRPYSTPIMIRVRFSPSANISIQRSESSSIKPSCRWMKAYSSMSKEGARSENQKGKVETYHVGICLPFASLKRMLQRLEKV
ncbi:hypothetical protein KP509_03G079600 [Ceratopteris richardii]|uniref:Uncharacterized protein n=4 Tax=Ceratopteris richardii TaxID=49495 RepID=A0A8T2V8M8_CERRI|nr:hypothetical protein KP509_03G079600 [Ceratopteris richardii]